jgi:hypothetical protein
MRIASYKGTNPGVRGLFNILVRWWLGGPYSHSMLLFSDGTVGTSTLATGVTLYNPTINETDFDFVPVDGDEPTARAWFEANQGRRYDILGLFGFVWRRGVEDKGGCFCSEAIAAALGFPDAYRFDPVILHIIFSRKK